MSQAVNRAEEGVSIFKELGDRPWLAYAQLVLALTWISAGKAASARSLLAESRALQRDAGSPLGASLEPWMLLHEGRAAAALGDLAAARANYNQSLELFRTARDRVGIAFVQNAMGIVASSTPDTVVETVGALIADGRQVVAFAAQGRPAGTASATPAERVLEQVELEKVRIQGSVRPVRTGAPGRPGLVVVMAVAAIEDG